MEKDTISAIIILLAILLITSITILVMGFAEDKVGTKLANKICEDKYDMQLRGYINLFNQGDEIKCEPKYNQERIVSIG